jgi:hypothetical protein
MIDAGRTGACLILIAGIEVFSLDTLENLTASEFRSCANRLSTIHSCVLIVALKSTPTRTKLPAAADLVPRRPLRTPLKPASGCRFSIRHTVTNRKQHMPVPDLHVVPDERASQALRHPAPGRTFH